MLRRDWPVLIIFLGLMLFLSFRALEYGMAKHLVETGEIQVRSERCEDVTRHSVTAHGPYFYRLQFRDGTRLSTIYEGGFDTSLNGYEELQEQLSQMCAFRYVSVNILGIQKHYLVSASNGEWSAGTEYEAVRPLGSRARLDGILAAIILAALVVVYTPSISENLFALPAAWCVSFISWCRRRKERRTGARGK